MYLSEIHLLNWRSYADARFQFRKPTNRRPLVLVGALNGHGKTSFLLALYLGLFGRFGLRHAEGFGAFEGEDLPFYRQAIQRFRRSTADPDEPTAVELVFSPCADEPDEPEVRVIRRWFFNGGGKPKQGDAFETVELHVDGKVQRLATGLDAAHDRLERLLFPASFMPAFFFDGEQAQSLIMNSGEKGLRKAVEVLFGTKIISEVRDQVKQFLSASHGKMGGKRNVNAQQQVHAQKVEERTRLERELAELQGQFGALERKKTDLESEHRSLMERLARLGGERKGDVESAHEDARKAEEQKLQAEEALTEKARALGLALAVSRLSPAISNRLRAEAAREQWERLRDGTLVRAEAVLEVALPEPPERDELLGNLAVHIREQVRQRFALALEHIYNPPPKDCAAEYLLGHAKGELRDRLLEALTAASRQSANDIRSCARRLKLAREELEDAQARKNRLGDLPREVSELSSKVTEIQTQISDCSRQLGATEREIQSKRAILRDLSAEIGRLQELLAALGPEQRRIAVAERVYRTLEAIGQELGPITLQRLQELVTKHFIAIADTRYKGGEVVFPEGGAPVLKRYGQPDHLIETMSGFERRSFGIAFSLALAEITRRRLPLVIDTPLGNADNDYRPRLLKAVTDVELDQIIILTHDAEVNGRLFEQVEGQVQQTFLVEFDRDRGESKVNANTFFAGVGR